VTRDWTELDAIVKRQYQTGDYSNAHLKVPKTLLDDMRTHRPPPLPDWADRSLGPIMGIRIVVDDALPDGEWRLVDNSTGDLLTSGAA
jgi:hypothetical protein